MKKYSLKVFVWAHTQLHAHAVQILSLDGVHPAQAPVAGVCCLRPCSSGARGRGLRQGRQAVAVACARAAGACAPRHGAQPAARVSGSGALQ